MKILVQKFGGEEVYSTPGITGELNGKEPDITEKVEVTEVDGKNLLEHPSEFKLKKDKNGKHELIKKHAKSS